MSFLNGLPQGIYQWKAETRAILFTYFKTPMHRILDPGVNVRKTLFEKEAYLESMTFGNSLDLALSPNLLASH